MHLSLLPRSFNLRTRRGVPDLGQDGLKVRPKNRKRPVLIALTTESGCHDNEVPFFDRMTAIQLQPLFPLDRFGLWRACRLLPK